MLKKWTALFLLIVCLLSAAQGESVRKVYRVGEAAPFAADAQTLDLYVCPLGGADCMIVTAQGQSMLVDMGKTTDAGVIAGLLRELDIARVDIAFNTHPHDDHIGGIRRLVEDFEFGAFMTAFPEDFVAPDSEQQITLPILREAGVPIQVVADGDVFSLGDARVTVMRQGGSNPNLNQMSAVLKIEFGACSVLLTADILGATQQHLAERYDLKSDILKYPHHGIDNAMRVFMEAVAPEYAFITNNKYSSAAGQQSLGWFRIPFDYAMNGTIHLSTDGAYWLVEQRADTMKYR